MEDIKNYDVYTNGLRKSIIDKLFFVNIVDECSCYLDFGCGDGSLIYYMAKSFPDCKYVGYDCNPKMVELGREKIKNLPNATITSDLNLALYECGNRDICLILNSVIHEIYSYSDPNKFWDIVFNSGFKNIVIRDMIPQDSICSQSDRLDIVKVSTGIPDYICKTFINKWGSLSRNKELYHLLLKYRYIENWDREVNENYFPLLYNELINLIPIKYKVIYSENFIVPFIKNKVLQDLDIDMKYNTHTKLILKRNDQRI